MSGKKDGLESLLRAFLSQKCNLTVKLFEVILFNSRVGIESQNTVRHADPFSTQPNRKETIT